MKMQSEAFFHTLINVPFRATCIEQGLEGINTEEIIEAWLRSHKSRIQQLEVVRGSLHPRGRV